MTTGVYTLAVGYTVQRPIIPDQRTAWVQVQADSEYEAWVLACDMVKTTAPDCVMPTSTKVLAWL